MKSNIMKKEWDKLARINPFYSVYSRADFENPQRINLGFFWKTGQNDTDFVLSKLCLGNTRRLKMVEIGCGIGRMTHHFSKLFGHVYAIDVSEEMLNCARGYWGELKNVDFILGSGQNLSMIRDSSVDFVVSFVVLFHAPNPKVVLNYIREASRVLKPNGIVYMQLRVSSGSLIKRLIHRCPSFKNVMNSLKMCISTNRFPSLKQEFRRSFKVWRGSSVQEDKIQKLAFETGLQIQDITRETYTMTSLYTFKKL